MFTACASGALSLGRHQEQKMFRKSREEEGLGRASRGRGASGLGLHGLRKRQLRGMQSGLVVSARPAKQLRHSE